MLIKVKARSRISFEKLVKWLYRNARLEHFHTVKASIYVNDQAHMNTDCSTPKADDRAHSWLTGHHRAGAFMSRFGELSSHRVPDMPPAR